MCALTVRHVISVCVCVRVRACVRACMCVRACWCVCAGVTQRRQIITGEYEPTEEESELAFDEEEEDAEDEPMAVAAEGAKVSCYVDAL